MGAQLTRPVTASTSSSGRGGGSYRNSRGSTAVVTPEQEQEQELRSETEGNRGEILIALDETAESVDRNDVMETGGENEDCESDEGRDNDRNNSSSRTKNVTTPSPSPPAHHPAVALSLKTSSNYGRHSRQSLVPMSNEKEEAPEEEKDEELAKVGEYEEKDERKHQGKRLMRRSSSSASIFSSASTSTTWGLRSSYIRTGISSFRQNSLTGVRKSRTSSLIGGSGVDSVVREEEEAVDEEKEKVDEIVNEVRGIHDSFAELPGGNEWSRPSSIETTSVILMMMPMEGSGGGEGDGGGEYEGDSEDMGGPGDSAASADCRQEDSALVALESSEPSSFNRASTPSSSISIEDTSTHPEPLSFYSPSRTPADPPSLPSKGSSSRSRSSSSSSSNLCGSDCALVDPDSEICSIYSTDSASSSRYASSVALSTITISSRFQRLLMRDGGVNLYPTFCQRLMSIRRRRRQSWLYKLDAEIATQADDEEETLLLDASAAMQQGVRRSMNKRMLSIRQRPSRYRRAAAAESEMERERKCGGREQDNEISEIPPMPIIPLRFSTAALAVASATVPESFPTANTTRTTTTTTTTAAAAISLTFSTTTSTTTATSSPSPSSSASSSKASADSRSSSPASTSTSFSADPNSDPPRRSSRLLRFRFQHVVRTASVQPRPESTASRATTVTSTSSRSATGSLISKLRRIPLCQPFITVSHSSSSFTSSFRSHSRNSASPDNRHHHHCNAVELPAPVPHLQWRLFHHRMSQQQQQQQGEVGASCAPIGRQGSTSGWSMYEKEVGWVYQHPGVKILGQHEGEVWDDEARRMRRERAEIREMGRKGLGWSGLENGEGTEAEREVEWVELEG